LRIPEEITQRGYPVEERRRLPVDMTHSRYSDGTEFMNNELVFPKQWKMISVPKNVSLSSRYGTYELRFDLKGNTITCTRKAVYSLYRTLTPEDYAPYRAFLNEASNADKVQYLFFCK
jgi:hypothetical protein